jgi:hypothetical protein
MTTGERSGNRSRVPTSGAADVTRLRRAHNLISCFWGTQRPKERMALSLKRTTSHNLLQRVDPGCSAKRPNLMRGLAEGYPTFSTRDSR